MTNKRVCEICGTVYDASLDCCPLCDTPYQTKIDPATRPVSAKQSKTAQDEQAPAESGFKMVVAVALAVLMVLFAGFIAYEFFFGSPASNGTVACTGLFLSANSVDLNENGEVYYLSVRATPEEVTDKISYTSANDDIAVVDSMGKLTAVAEGETEVTVVCGTYSATCQVTCDFQK